MATLIKNGRVAPSASPPDLVLEPGDDPARHAEAIAAARVIAVAFPKFSDGRGYSIARLLRERHAYRGELRAVGAVARDLLQPMARCGFDAFLLREGENVEEALAAFADFSDCYQATVPEPRPLFRRRQASRP